MVCGNSGKAVALGVLTEELNCAPILKVFTGADPRTYLEGPHATKNAGRKAISSTSPLLLSSFDLRLRVERATRGDK
jgi:hypothetical protein